MDSGTTGYVFDRADKRGARRPVPGWLAIAVLCAVGCLYYASYFRYGFNWADEGAVALIAERLGAGERPFVDVEPGYGILWFYPIAWLYKLFGIHFWVVRGYFIVLGFAAALFAYALLQRLTRNRVVALATGLLVLVFPGSGYKTYIPLLVISGAYVLFLFDARTRKPIVAPWMAVAANGIYLALAFLIRADIATVFAFLFVLYHLLLASQAALRSEVESGWALAARRTAATFAIAAVTSLPFLIHAEIAGYLQGYLRQYYAYALELISKLYARLIPDSTSVTAAAGTLMARAQLWPVRDVHEVGLAFLTYAPLLVLLFIALFLVMELFATTMRRHAIADFLSERAYLIVLTGAAFSAFPQFFIWRPDIAHLSEFTPGLIVLCAYFLVVLIRASSPASDADRTRRWLLLVVMGVCLVDGGGYALAYRHEGPYLRVGASYRLVIPERLDAWLDRDDYEALRWLNEKVRAASSPGDYVLCFPYCPGVNFVTARPTFQKFLYVDDGVLGSHPHWLDEMREEIASRKPKVIVIWNWAINRTEISRFRNWAAPLYDFIARTYEREGPFMGYEVFVRKSP